MTARYLRLLLLLLLVTTGISMTGCRRMIERQVIHDEIVERKNQVVISATLRDGSIVHFDDSGASYQWMMVAGDRVPGIAGRSIQGDPVTIPISDIAEARIRRRMYDGAATVMTIITVTTTALAVLLIMFMSGFKT